LINDISDIKLSDLEINGQVGFIKTKEKDWKTATTIIGCCIYIIVVWMDTILKSIIKRQIPFLIGGTITGSIMAYYYGFLFTIIVNSIMWYVISYLVSKYYYKSKGINDQKYLIQYGLSKIKSRHKTVKTS
jgi:p-aminobenzoyl-glutamate transporter AbgT